MKTHVQWALAHEKDWDNIDSMEWEGLPKGPIPDAVSVIDDTKKWVHGLNIQGVVFDGYDHYAIEEILNGVKVTVWNDDSDDWLDDFHAMEWYLLKPALDIKFNKVNTRQLFDLYAESDIRAKKYENVDICRAIFPWSTFSKPREVVIRHGIWAPDVLNKKLLDVRTRHGWREWVESLTAVVIGTARVRADLRKKLAVEI